MTKTNMIALALTSLALCACGKSEAQKAVESINLNPTPVKEPVKPAPVSWAGIGSLKMTGSQDLPCASVTAEIFEDANGFELRKFSYDCSGMAANTDPIRLDLRGTELFLGANKVGTKQANIVEFELHDPSGPSLGFRFLNNGSVLQAEHSMKANGFEQLLTATLKR